MQNRRWIIAAALGGGMLAVGIMTLIKPASPPPVALSSPIEQVGDDSAEMARYRGIVTADARCDALWKKRREHFFSRSGKETARSRGETQGVDGRE